MKASIYIAGWGKVADARDHRLLRVRPFDHTNHTAHGLGRESKSDLENNTGTSGTRTTWGFIKQEENITGDDETPHHLVGEGGGPHICPPLHRRACLPKGRRNLRWVLFLERNGNDNIMGRQPRLEPTEADE